MKKVSGFYVSKLKKPNELMKQIQLSKMKQQRQKLKKLISQRKKKWKQAMEPSSLKLPNFNYLKKFYSDFSFVIPNASKEPFITEKIKKNLAISPRAFSSEPNLKVGKTNQLFENKRDVEDPIVLNKKFMEFDRILTEQTGIYKIQALKQLDPKVLKTRDNGNKCTKDQYFQKISTDRYNFYKTNDYHSICSLKSSMQQINRQNIDNLNAKTLSPSKKLIQEFTLPLIKSSRPKRYAAVKSRYLNEKIQINLKQNCDTLNISLASQSRTLKNSKKYSESSEDILGKSDFSLKKLVKKNSKTGIIVSFDKNINSIQP